MYPRVLANLESVGSMVISLVFELETVFAQKDKAGVAHKTEAECVSLAVKHLRSCIAGTATSPPVTASER